MWARLKTSKAAWTAVIGIVTAVSYAPPFLASLTWVEVLAAVGNGLAVLFWRDGVAKATA